MDEIMQVLLEIKNIEERFSKIQENPALYGPENGFTEDELKKLDLIISLIGESSISATAILKRYSL